MKQSQNIDEVNGTSATTFKILIIGWMTLSELRHSHCDEHCPLEVTTTRSTIWCYRRVNSRPQWFQFSIRILSQKNIGECLDSQDKIKPNPVVDSEARLVFFWRVSTTLRWNIIPTLHSGTESKRRIGGFMKTKTVNWAGKKTALFFWDAPRIIYTYYLGKGSIMHCY